jgi:hypothetical protein
MLVVFASRQMGADVSFGKAGENGGPPRRPPLQVATAKAASSSGGLDKAFIALVFGVMVAAAGVAMVGPPVFSWVGGALFAGQARPVDKVVAGLDKDAAKAALASEAFPDDAGRGFMSALAAKFPGEHDLLLGKLSDAAMKGADREGLVMVVGEWTADFAPRNLAAMGRTGSDGFDKVVSLASDALGMLEQAGGGNCNLKSLEKIASDPAMIASLGAYGSPGYKLGMRANQLLVDLAAAGKNAPPPDTRLRPEDENALQSAFFAMASDPQIMSLMQSSMLSGQQPSPDALAANLNVCQLGRTVVVKLRNLPAGTKARLWAIGTSQGANLSF